MQSFERRFIQRSIFIGLLFFVMLLVLVLRLYQLQIVEGEKYKTLADGNRITYRPQLPARGDILDRNGDILATNRPMYRLSISRLKNQSTEALLDKLATLVELSDEDTERCLKHLRKRRPGAVTVKEELSWEEVARLEFLQYQYPQIQVERALRRTYPLGEAGAHVLGYVGMPPKDVPKARVLFDLPDYRVGRAGLERVYESRLFGTPGSFKLEVNAGRSVIRELHHEKSQKGEDLKLTLDKELQLYVAKSLEGYSGTAIVMDVHTGDLLAMASAPSFDPQFFGRKFSSKEWQALLNNPRKPFLNKAIAGAYPPASLFKLIVGLAALEHPGFNPNWTVNCATHKEYYGRRFHCWKGYGGHGKIDFYRGMLQSCDIYYYELALKIGLDPIIEMAKKFGYGQSTFIELLGEAKGFLPTKDWKRRVLRSNWLPGETLMTGIGQGYLSATPIQMTVATAAVVNGGYLVTPRFTAEGALPGPRKIDVSAQQLRRLVNTLDGVMNDPKGTGYRRRIKEDGFAMGGKSGTSQVRTITMQEREQGKLKNEELEWLQRDHSLFTGYAPVSNPKYAVTVVIEHGGWGSQAAAPIARDILLFVQKHLGEGS